MSKKIQELPSITPSKDDVIVVENSTDTGKATLDEVIKNMLGLKIVNNKLCVVREE